MAATINPSPVYLYLLNPAHHSSQRISLLNPNTALKLLSSPCTEEHHQIWLASFHIPACAIITTPIPMSHNISTLMKLSHQPLNIHTARFHCFSKPIVSYLVVISTSGVYSIWTHIAVLSTSWHQSGTPPPRVSPSDESYGSRRSKKKEEIEDDDKDDDKDQDERGTKKYKSTPKNHKKGKTEKRKMKSEKVRKWRRERERESGSGREIERENGWRWVHATGYGTTQ